MGFSLAVMRRHDISRLVATLFVIGYANAQAQAPQIIDNPSPRWKPAEALRLAATPSLLIGTQPGPMYEFGRVAGTARLRDGRIVVADGASLSLRFFDSTGKFLKTAGGRGEGPGEFQALQYFASMPGDTLVAGGIMGDLSYFTGSGQYLERRGTMNPPLQIAKTGRPFVLVSLNGSGTRLIAVVPRPSPRGGGSRWVDSFPVAIVDAHNVEVHRLGTLPSMEFGMSGSNPHTTWFGATTTIASDGRLFYIGYGSEYAIRVYSTQGNLVRIIRRAWTPVRVTKSDIDTYVVEWGKRWIKSTGAAAEAERASLRSDPYAATVPAFSQFIADRVGRLWVREAHLADAPGAGALNTIPLVPSTWSVFDPEGHWLGDVTMPVRFQPTDIGADYVLGKALDADDVPLIKLYRLGSSQKIR